MLGADDMNVCWPVVVRVDDYSKVANFQDGRHRRRIAYSQAVGLTHIDRIESKEKRFELARIPT